MLDEKLLKQISGAYDLELVTRIDLSFKECAKHGIQKQSSLEGVAALVNLVELDISGHKISDLSPLGSLQKLERVNLSNNELTGVNGLQQQQTGESQFARELNPVVGPCRTFSTTWIFEAFVFAERRY